MATVDVWLTGGQSNMVGLGTWQNAPVTRSFAWEAGDDPALPHLNDPNTGGNYKAENGSILHAFVNRIIDSTERPTVVIRGAYSGSSVMQQNDPLEHGASNAVFPYTSGNWSPTGTRFEQSCVRYLAGIQQILDAGHTIANVHVIWDGGQSDGIYGVDLEDFKGEFAALLGRFRTRLSRPALKMYVVRIGTRVDKAEEPGWAIVRDLQDEACAETPGMVMCYRDAVNFGTYGYFNSDGIHYNQNGLNTVGYALADAIIADLGFAPPPPLVLGPPSSRAGILLRTTTPDAIIVPTRVDFTSAGTTTWTCPTGIKGQARVYAVGGGGGGDGGGFLGAGGGGGRGGHLVAADLDLVPGTVYTIVVGTGGTAGAYNTDAPAGNGAPSQFKQGATVLVEAPAGNGGGATGGQGFLGATGTTGTAVGQFINPGTPGGSAANASGSVGGAGGAGGAPLGAAGGAGGTGGDAAANVGKPGVAPGGGGGGGMGSTANGVGGVGAVGGVRIEYRT